MARKVNIVRAAHQYLGVPYVWGGTSNSGLDCSGFLQRAYGDVGVHIPRVTYDQFKTGHAVGLRQLRPGDAVFIEPGKDGPNHVGMYIGKGMVQQSPHTGTVNSVVSLKSFVAGGFVGARRYIGNAGGSPLVSGPNAIGVGGHATAIGGQGQGALLGLLGGVLSRNSQRQAPNVAPAPAPTVQKALPGFRMGL